MSIIYGAGGLPLVKDEINNLIEKHEKGKQMLLDNKKRSKLQMLKERTVYYPFIIMIIYFGIQQFSGVMVVVFYAIDIAKDAQITANPYLIIMLIAITRVLTSLFVSYTSKNVGRRCISLISGIGVSITLYSLALYIIIDTYIIDKNINIPSSIPIILIILFIILSTYGLLTVPFAMVSEMFPLRVRGFMVGLTIAISYVMCFISIKIYPIIRLELENYWIFIIYGTVSTIGTIFLFKFLPETNGKTLQEIEEYFMNN